MTKHKIAFHLNSMAQGGAERVVSNLANRFAQEGYEVLVATEWFAADEFALDPSIRRVHVGLEAGEEKKGRLAKIRLRCAHLRRFLVQERPDIVIAFTHTPNFRALMAARGTKIPVLISVRTDPVDHYDSLRDRIQMPFLLPRAAGCVFQTLGQKEFFAPFLQKNSRIILNPLHPKYCHTAPPKKRQKTVVQSGRIVGFKNQTMLIDAFLKVHEKHPDYTLQIYGPDSGDGTWQKLEKQIADNRAEAYVKLMGGSDSLEKELADAGVFAFSSDWEGLPNALIEAMALGLPCVATDCPCGGPRTIMTDGVDGLLVPIKDPKALEEGILRLIEDRSLAERLGRNARKIIEKTNEDAIFAQWRDYIEECL